MADASLLLSFLNYCEEAVIYIYLSKTMCLSVYSRLTTRRHPRGGKSIRTAPRPLWTGTQTAFLPL